MDVTKWQTRLEKNFKVGNVTGGYLVKVLNQEEAFRNYVLQKFYGHVVLMDCFYSFFIETVNIAVRLAKMKGIPSNCSHYPILLMYYITIFRSFRAAENLLLKGYPFDGFALLRDLKDRAMIIGALIHGKTSFIKLNGVKPGEQVTEENFPRIKKEIEKEERHVLNEMVRNKSGLPIEIQKEIKNWESLFNAEVHGSRLTFAQDLDWLLGKKPLSLGPVPNEKGPAMYMNRASEIGWFIVRTFPFLQLEPGSFGREWEQRLSILDDSFRIMVEALGKSGKKIGGAILILAEKKFSFPYDLHYQEFSHE
jgi:hypothetical protein